MDPSYKFKKDHIKILDKDVKVVIIVENPSADFDADMHFRYRWDITIEFYLHRKFKLLPTYLDKKYYHYCYTDTNYQNKNYKSIKIHIPPSASYTLTAVFSFNIGFFYIFHKILKTPVFYTTLQIYLNCCNFYSLFISAPSRCKHSSISSYPLSIW